MPSHPKSRQTAADKAGSKDGAPPGASAPNGRYAFDADARAKAREAAPVTIGETQFHRRRKNWEATRGLRELLRRQDKARGRTQRLVARIEALTEKIRGIPRVDPDGMRLPGWEVPPLTDDTEITQLEEQVDEFETKIDEAADEGDEAAYEIIALLLRDDDGNPPAIDHLKEHLDVTEAGDLAGALAHGGESVEGPTPTETSSN